MNARGCWASSRSDWRGFVAPSYGAPMPGRRQLVFMVAIAGLAAPLVWPTFGIAGSPQAKAARPLVVELYTSQGCSSCPPADAFLAKLSSHKDILAMSLPVTYWDMLGWRDTLANEANTKRQKAYAKVMGRGGIYTPQIIVDGESDIVGSKEQAVEAEVTERMADMPVVPVELSAEHGVVHVAIGAGAEHAVHDATVWMFRILPQVTVAIHSGENGGRTITYHNVVRQIRAVGQWKGQALSLDLPVADQSVEHDDGVAIVVQQGSGYGRVLGAAMIDRVGSSSRR